MTEIVQKMNTLDVGEAVGAFLQKRGHKWKKSEGFPRVVKDLQGTEALEVELGVLIKGDFPGCDLSVPDFSWRFGERRRWHMRYSYLYYNEGGELVAPFMARGLVAGCRPLP
jgi:hypothetical protein